MQVVVVVLISLLYCSVQSQILKHKEERKEKDKTMLYHKLTGIVRSTMLTAVC